MSRVPQYDAVVVGAGHNGPVAANLLADAGWSVLVLEAEPTPGGAVRSAEVLEPGFTTDLFSAFYPLGAETPIRNLYLASAGAHPGGGVHGGPGGNAAKAALHAGARGALRSAAVRFALRLMYSGPDRGVLPASVAGLPKG